MTQTDTLHIEECLKCGCLYNWMEQKEVVSLGFWMDVDGEPVHMLADPNMSDETAEALVELVRATRKMLDDKSLTLLQDGTPMCLRCGKHPTKKADGICGSCRLKEIQDTFAK